MSLRVAYVCADRGVPVFGCKGSSVHVQEVLRALLRRGAQVDLFAARLGGDRPEDLGDVRVHRLARPPRTRAEADPIAVGAGPRRANGPTQAGADSEADRLVTDRSLDRQLAAATTPFDLVYERHALFSSSAMRFARLRGLPGVLEVNAPLVEEQLAHRRLAHPARARSMAREALCAASLRVAVSHGVVDGHRAYGLDRDDFLVCPNGVDPARFAWDIPTARTRETRESFTIGFLGTLKPWHGLDVLLEAFGLLAVRDPAYRLLVVGDGPQRERIESFCAQAGLSGRVELTGAAEPREVPRWLARMDVGTAPYDAPEGHYFSPLKVVEYMAAGLPVVASRTGQLPDLVEEGREGLLLPPGDAQALATALEGLRRNRALAVAMGERGRARVLAEHTWDAILERVLAAALRAGPTRSVPRTAGLPSGGA